MSARQSAATDQVTTMKTYRIRWDFSKAQPRWGASLTQDFGERNEGVTVEAESPNDAFAKFNADRLPGARYNPFYLKAEPV